MEELKDNLIRDVTHELKTPVAKIEMAIDMFERSLKTGNEGVSKRGSQVHEILRNNIGRLKNSIKNILDISKLESGMELLKISLFSVDDVVKQIVREMVAAATVKGNAITILLPTGLPMIRADRDKIYQVVAHLIDNAIKFTEQGKINISARALPDALEVTVEDTGRGLDEETKIRVFEKFYKETSSAYGSGIGLAICKNIVQIHKGKIWVESQGKGMGSRFKFTLPLAENR
ncbi:MAG: hypothetical protein AYP45_02070 [Candidatus Brocadia carolinensis]|uniref:histidine kinase n=1 Tax=Candidatus Brocadia carolinensis TaxID=1004156 RepID=A0A1V4AX17_9BACT|nr:MAG: hypothetical protein AYP45_02070 [Candidatus Brocadia caroliniensis]